MAHTKRTRKTAPTAAAARQTGAAGRLSGGQRRPYGLIAALALSLATAIAAAAWLIATQEVTGMTAITTPEAHATASIASTPAAPVAPAATTAADTRTNAATSVDAAASSATQPTMQQSTATTTQQPAAPSAAGQRAFIDPATGEFRPAEHDEIAALNAAAAASAPARRSAAARTASAEFFIEDGSVGAVVPEELHTFTVATRGADGRIVIDHVQGARNADRLVKANGAKNPQASVSRAQQKEGRNDR